jgi:hypothetical protein
VVFAMLDACAPTHRRRLKEHHWWVWLGSACYQGLPKGAHGRAERAEVEAGHVRKMVRRLGVDPACAETAIPGLWG